MSLGSKSGLILATALALGIACGTAAKGTKSNLAPAGSARDDGSGLLAQASSEFTRRGDTGGRTYGGDSYTTGVWGGGAYGGHVYGGGIYGNYTFSQRIARDSDVSSYSNNYVVDEKLKTGRIVGRVSWKKKPAADTVASKTCAAETAPASEVPRHAVVFLRKIKRGRGFPVLEGYPQKRWQVGGSLRVKPCKLSPYVQVVAPIGGIVRAKLAVGNADRVRLRDVKDPMAVPSGTTAVDLEFASRGDVRVGQMRTAGPQVVGNSKGALAWIVVGDHPYYVNVDPDGSFTLLDVPAGSYELVAWHPPIPTASGKLTKPLEVTSRVKVRVGQKTTAQLRLPSR